MEEYLRMSRDRPRSHILRWVINSGPDDQILNIFHILGLPLITVVAAVGRTMLTTSIVTGYLVVVAAYITCKSYRSCAAHC